MWKLSEVNEELPELKKKVTCLEEELQVSESRVKELESTLDREREEHESRMNEVVAQHEESTTVSLHVHVRLTVLIVVFLACGERISSVL